MQNFPLNETTFLLSGPVGNIEILAAPAETKHRNAVAVICHPHPLHGGTMTNKVVTTLAKTFRELGLNTVRFNFRGVGKSDGNFSQGIGETDDLLAVVDWVKKTCPGDDVWLAGFSFGAFVAARAATKMSCQQLVTVAPQVSRFLEEKIPEITCPWILVQGDADEVIAPEEVYAWIDTLKNKPVLIRMPETSHFFHGKLGALQQNLMDALIGR